ncbi:MAG TPA: DMT family transporter [Chitinophagaceae bacterium]|jgi:drug/metabolite transporter (DMT)-like permease|nr:DMT family transporter [Chitinophagaceae bacterium]
MHVNKLINWLLFIVLTIIWGSSFILMKHSKEELSASQIAALRIFSGGIVLMPLAAVHITRVFSKKILIIILSGITGNLLPAFLFASAIAKNIDSSLAAILNSFTPIFVVLIAIVIFRDKVKLQRIIGVVVGFIGLLLLFLLWKGISFENFKYSLLILLATVLYGVNVNVVGHFLKDVPPLYIATISLTFMIVPTTWVLWQQNFLHLAFGGAGVQWAIVETTILGVVGSAIGTILFYILIKRAGGIFASLVTYGVPFVGILWGISDGEKITIKQVACLGIILFGVYLANVPVKKENKKEVLLSEEFAEGS